MDSYKIFEKELDKRLNKDINFDIIKRELLIGKRNSALYFIDGFIKDEVFEKMLEYLFKQTDKDLEQIKDMQNFSLDKMPYVEVDYTYDTDTAVNQVLSGPAVLIIDGIDGALIIDTRTYPSRSPEEPQKDKSLRGSRDGFVETLVVNTALIRRRIRSENLRMEYMSVSGNSKTDIVISYIDGLADKKTLKNLKKALKNIKLKSVSMTSEALTEALIPHKFFNPFPRFKLTERPDFASAAILDGKIVVIMDNSPTVMVLPDSFADFFREADDYYFLPIISSYTRILRLVVAVFTVIATPLYLLIMNEQDLVPQFLRFLIADKTGALPLFIQFLLLELVTDGLRLASLNTPDALSNSLGIIGGLLLSEFAINAGWFIGESVLFMSFVTIASYTQPSFEMGYAMKFERILLLILTQFLGLWGFFAGIAVCLILMLSTKTLSGRCYLYPVIPFNAKAFARLFFRPTVRKEN
ncbi:MAG: spore germination protein [Acutalibacteraceae bacterium]|nr:spore germination protein [Acutalibacteraceae bacterium]